MKVIKVIKVMYYTYIILCEDNSLYTGITNNLERRMEEHFEQTKKCAKYTLHHKVKKIEIVWSSPNRKTASKLEYHIKKLTKIEKESLIKKESNFSLLFKDTLDCSVYQKENLRSFSKS